jgi:hypothetical protein
MDSLLLVLRCRNPEGLHHNAYRGHKIWLPWKENMAAQLIFFHKQAYHFSVPKQ